MSGRKSTRRVQSQNHISPPKSKNLHNSLPKENYRELKCKAKLKRPKLKRKPLESKLSDEASDDDWSLGGASSDVELLTYACTGEFCVASLKDFIIKECKELGIVCSLREAPRCNNRWGKVRKGSNFYSCSNFQNCDVDVCEECFPYHLEEPNSITIDGLTLLCGKKGCKRKVKEFIEKTCNIRGMSCDFKLQKVCKKRFGKIRLDTNFLSCVTSDTERCHENICLDCSNNTHGTKIIHNITPKKRQLKPSLYLSSDLSYRLGAKRKFQISRYATQKWPPQEARAAMSFLNERVPASQIIKRFGHDFGKAEEGKSCDTQETRDLANIIWKLAHVKQKK